MPDVIMNGPEGRLEGRYQHGKLPNAPIALMLHPHPQHGGTMNNKVIYTLYHGFARRGFDPDTAIADTAATRRRRNRDDDEHKFCDPVRR